MSATTRDLSAMRINACAVAYFALSILLMLGTSVAHAGPLSDAGMGTTAAGVHADLLSGIAQHDLPVQVSGFSDPSDANGDNVERQDIAAAEEFSGETFPAPGALAGGASTTGGLDRGRLEPASWPTHTSTSAAVLEASFSSGVSTPSRVMEELASDDALLALGAGSRLFGSHTPTSPAGNSNTNGSPGAVGVLTLLGSSFASTGLGRPPLPPYGRRVTWTFRAPTTRPG